MANEEFKKDTGAIGSLHNALECLLKETVVSADPELKAKVDKIVGSLYRQFKQNEIKSNYESEIEWCKGKTRLNFSVSFVFAAVAIAAAVVFTVFLPAIPVLAIIVPFLFGVASLVTLKIGFVRKHSATEQEQYLERYKKDIDPVKSTELLSGKMTPEMLNIMIRLRNGLPNLGASAGKASQQKEIKILIP